jgi:CTP synthase (UTP-ammonia lyase)
VVSKLACSLVGKSQMIKILAGSLFHETYGQDEVKEQFVCNYGLNLKFRDSIEKGRLKVVGVDLEGEVRAVEVTDHPFFVGTLYQPQISSTSESPHPLIVAYLRSALEFQKTGK